MPLRCTKALDQFAQAVNVGGKLLAAFIAGCCAVTPSSSSGPMVCFSINLSTSGNDASMTLQVSPDRLASQCHCGQDLKSDTSRPFSGSSLDTAVNQH